MNELTHIALLLVAGTAQAAPLRSATVEIRVRLQISEGASAPATDAVVWLADQLPSAGKAARVIQEFKRFEPRVTVVPVGSVIAFVNFDRIDHNVFSLSATKPFDLGLYRDRASRAVRTDRPGVVRVHCNIHPQMAAYLVVVASRIFAKTDAQGMARLTRVPAGAHALRVWHELGGESETLFTTPLAAPLDVVLDARSWTPESHRNKYGEDYSLANNERLY